MELTILPDLVRADTESNHNFALLLENARTRLEKIAEAAGERDPLQQGLHEVCPAAIAFALRQQSTIIDLWGIIRSRFEEGVEGDHGRQLVNGFLGVLTSWFPLARAAGKLLALGERFGVGVKDRERLPAAIEEAQTLQYKAAKLLAILDRPLPSVDEERLAAGRRDFAAGRFKTTDQLRDALGHG